MNNKYRLYEFETKSKYHTINTIETETFAETVMRFCEMKEITSSRMFSISVSPSVSPTSPSSRASCAPRC